RGGGTRPRRPWRQPDRAHLHGRSVGRLVVRGAPPRGTSEPGSLRARRRWAAPARRVRDGRQPLPATAKPADAVLAGQLPALLGRGARAAWAQAGGRRARLVRLGWFAEGPRRG